MSQLTHPSSRCTGVPHDRDRNVAGRGTVWRYSFPSFIVGILKDNSSFTGGIAGGRLS
jgi:hypothetical protein